MVGSDSYASGEQFVPLSRELGAWVPLTSIQNVPAHTLDTNNSPSSDLFVKMYQNNLGWDNIYSDQASFTD